MALDVIVMAAGKGTRMKSRQPKVLQRLGGRPLLGHVLDTAARLDAGRCIVIHGHGGPAVQAAFTEAPLPLTWVEQAEQWGTGHAVQQALPVLPHNGVSVILSGDVPLMRASSLRRLIEAAADGIAMMTLTLPDATGYGRVVRDASGHICRIVEQKDATPSEQAIREMNPGVYCVSNAWLHRFLPQLRNANAQGEYYLTDLIGMAADAGLHVGSVEPDDPIEIEGVNDRQQLASLERRYQRQQAERLMSEGVQLTDPDRFDLRGTLRCGQDVTIEPNVLIEGHCELSDGVLIGMGSVLKDAVIGPETVIAPYSVIEGATVGASNRIGPFARLRPQTTLGDDVQVGNFVELKNSQLAQGSKANHLAYVGDTAVGRDSNLGAGLITCNYDGANKHRTVIGDRVFIGSNSALVAPVTVGDGATVGAGSVITKSVEPDALAVARGQQRVITGWQRPQKAK